MIERRIVLGFAMFGQTIVHASDQIVHTVIGGFVLTLHGFQHGFYLAGTGVVGSAGAFLFL